MKVFILLLDGVGVGSQPDSRLFGDEGADTLGNVMRATGCRIPNLSLIGLIRHIDGYPAGLGAGGRLQQYSAGKDTTSGHWELMGVVQSAPFPLYPDGFPEEIITEVSRRIGRPVIGNRPASGTEIIEQLGEEHRASGAPIVYTSADSVFQVACHVDVVGKEELYEICRIAREEVLVGDHAVCRVIARPFMGSPGAYERTADRRDFSLAPPHDTLLDRLVSSGSSILGIGKIDDIFAGRGVTESHHTADNREGIDRFIRALRERSHDLVFANLVQFDSHWGHRRDPTGFANGLRELDRAVPEILDALDARDILVVTADHGCDPTHSGTDHTREYVPCLFLGERFIPAVDFGTAPMTALADTLADLFDLSNWHSSNNLLPRIVRSDRRIAQR